MDEHKLFFRLHDAPLQQTITPPCWHIIIATLHHLYDDVLLRTTTLSIFCNFCSTWYHNTQTWKFVWHILRTKEDTPPQVCTVTLQRIDIILCLSIEKRWTSWKT